MKAAIYHGPGDIRVENYPALETGPEGIIFKVRAAGICGTDVHTYRTGIFKEMSLPARGGGALFGHEFAGDVVAVGEHVTHVKVGDRAVGVTIGAYAEYVRVGPELTGTPLVYPLPDNVSYEEGATIEPLAVSLSAVRRGQPKPTDTVLILGAGMIGIGCLQVIRALYPVKQVIITDISEKRLAMAREMGADLTINALKEDVVEKMLELTGSAPVLFNTKPTAHVDLVIETAGATVTPQQAFQVVAPNTGRVVIVSLYENPPVIDLNDPVTKNHAIYGVFAFSLEEFEEALALMGAGKIERKSLISYRFSLDEAKEAFEAQCRTTDCFKAVFIM